MFGTSGTASTLTRRLSRTLTPKCPNISVTLWLRVTRKAQLWWTGHLEFIREYQLPQRTNTQIPPHVSFVRYPNTLVVQLTDTSSTFQHVGFRYYLQVPLSLPCFSGQLLATWSIILCQHPAKYKWGHKGITNRTAD